MSSFAYFNAGTRAAVYARATAGPGARAFATYQRTIVAVGGVVPQRIEGGSKMYKKNVSAKVPFKAIDSTGLGVTGLTITAKTAKDGANPTTASNAVVESGQGWYYITLTTTEMNGDIVVLDVSATGISIAPITISTESDYTAARAAYLSSDLAAIATAVNNISTATNAGDLATKQADSATLTTGSTISGTYASTATNDAVYWITAPVTPAVGGFGLRQQLVFDLPLGRIPIGIQVRGYFSGSSATVDIYALNSRTGVFDKLTNANTDLSSRNSDSLYAVPLPRDYADNSGGAFNIVTLEFRSASTNTTHRLRVDQILIAHVAESVAVTSTAPTADQIWSYVTRSLTTPGAEPVTVPTAVQIADEVQTRTIAAVTTVASVTGLTASNLDATVSSRASATAVAAIPTSAAPAAATVASAVRTELTTELGRVDAAISTRSTYAGADTAGTTTLLSRVTAAPLLASSYTAPDNAGIAAVKAKTDNLPSDPADASDIAGAFSTVNSTLTTIAGYVDTEVAAIKAKTDLIPASPAAVSDIPSAAANASAVRTELAVELARIDVAVSSVGGGGGSGPTAVEIADEVATRTLDANIKKVNSISINGTGTPGDTWGP